MTKSIVKKKIEFNKKKVVITMLFVIDNKLHPLE